MWDIGGGQSWAEAWESAVARRGDAVFLVYLSSDGARSQWSYRQFGAWVDRWAAWLSGLLGPHLNPATQGRLDQPNHANSLSYLDQPTHGPRVLVHVSNRPEFVVTLLALAKLGAVSVPAAAGVSPSELNELWRSSGAVLAVVDDELSSKHHGLGPVLKVGQVPPAPKGDLKATAWQSASGINGELDLNRELDSHRNPNGGDLAELLYTSGTTAKPKAVMITHDNLVFSGHYGMWQTSLRTDDVVVTSMPACHSNFQLAALTPVIAAGAQLVMVERYSARRFWGQVIAEHGTVVQLISMMVRTMLLQPETAGEKNHQVRAALYFMPLSPREHAGFEDRFGVQLINSYGSTESIGWSVTDPPTGERRWPSVGRAGLGYQAGVFDREGTELPPGQVGELRIKGTPGLSLMAGYFEDPQATAAALGEDGWLRTHDQGYCDAQGWFYFVDRAVNMIKRGGENVSTTEIETVLMDHPNVAEAAVIGLPDPIRDQLVKAYVRLCPGAQMSPAELIEYCQGRLSAFKVPQLVEIVEDFPRTPSMKVEKHLLKNS